MEYRLLGRTGLRVSELCFGTMQFGWTADEPTTNALLDHFVGASGNFIDTADIYTNWAGDVCAAGTSERMIGDCMASRSRDRSKLVLATKVRGRMDNSPNGEGLSYARVIQCCEDSLKRLKTDYIDLYQCHWADLNTPIEETLAAMHTLRQQGKIRYVGASNFPAWRLMEALWASDKHGYPRFDSYQPEYSLVERQLFEYEAGPLTKHHKLAVIPYSPLAGGFLTGKYTRQNQTVDSVRAGGIVSKYANDRGFAVIDALEEIAQQHGKSVSQTALSWHLSGPFTTAPIIGANTVEQLEELLGAVGYRLSIDEMERLNAATSWVRNGRPIWD